MEVLILTIFCSMILVIGGLILFFKSVKQGDFEHGDRLSLLPLEEDEYSEPEAGVKIEEAEGAGSPSGIS